MVHKPKVSVRIPAYNHEKYIGECLESVLNQTFQDFEIIITDDASTDRTVNVIKGYKDPRIKLEVFSKNQGCSAAVANCVKRSQGEYIANLCSDDAWENDKLEKQVAFIEANPQFSAVFTKVQLIDEESNNVTNHIGFYSTAFEVNNRSKEEWLNHFFYKGNCLCIPSVLIKKNVYEELNYQDKRIASLNDFDLWIRFCLKYELYILDEKLTRFRIRDNEANASANTVGNRIRNNFEFKQILNNYLQIDNTEKLLKIFPECNKYGQVCQETIPYFLGRLAYDTNNDFHQMWGLETIYNLMGEEAKVKKLEETCGFSYPDFHKLCSTADIYKVKLTNQLTDMDKKLKKIEQSQNKADQKIEKLQSEIDNILHSISWKITKPLRVAVNITRKFLGK